MSFSSCKALAALREPAVMADGAASFVFYGAAAFGAGTH